MADEVHHATGAPAAEPGESVHLPGPSYLPVIVAVATTLMVTGIVISWFLVAVGAILNVVAISRWIRETRRDIADLPLEH
jgi:nicotinamide riboside transporter PnuC